MEFNKKLQELRKQKNITQEELASALFVSRTAISKWESGRGLPSVDSLKALSTFFNVSVDELLSADELLFLAEADVKQKEKRYCDITFGLLDICTLLFLFVPIFAQRSGDIVSAASLLNLTSISPYLKITYITLTSIIFLCGVLTLAMQNCAATLWICVKTKLSIILNALTVVVFIISLQPYPAILLLAFLAIKLLIKKH